eukprot:GFUD01019629.1.p1 GENE.GFUD01019629.1~~GFUD01019629.1.p1  ORF type:complete len:487 (+),score=121.27 GFUD01019629.1:50-1510(+)
MSGLALTGGSLLSVFQGKRVYQPIWQIIYVYCPPGTNSSTSSQILVSDGKYLTYNVALHPHCHLTFQKSQWKTQNTGRTPEDVVSSYRFPYLKVVEYVVKQGDKTTVLFLSKVKLMGWERSERMPEILKNTDVEVVLGNSEVVLRSREGLENFDGPSIEICDPDCENNMKCERNFGEHQNLMSNIKPEELVASTKFTQDDLLYGDLAPLGPNGLDILTLCGKCSFLTYANESKTTTFKPPTKSLVDNLSDFLPKKLKFEFCSCDDENEQFRKEFQNKCMVVNQDSGPGADKKVQCILVSKEQKCLDHQGVEEFNNIRTEHPVGIKNGKQMPLKADQDSNKIEEIIHINGRVARVSGKLRLCEYCGVEETQMSACRQCGKVWYCSPACKRADVKPHATVCRAYITVRRYTEERVEFAKKLHEPEDGCGTCGFWRDTLEDCAKCGQVAYCCYRCKDKSAEKHRAVCEAFTVIGSYRKKYLFDRSQEVD